MPCGKKGHVKKCQDTAKKSSEKEAILDTGAAKHTDHTGSSHHLTVQQQMRLPSYTQSTYPMVKINVLKHERFLVLFF